MYNNLSPKRLLSSVPDDLIVDIDGIFQHIGYDYESGYINFSALFGDKKYDILSYILLKSQILNSLKSEINALQKKLQSDRDNIIYKAITSKASKESKTSVEERVKQTEEYQKVNEAYVLYYSYFEYIISTISTLEKIHYVIKNFESNSF